MSSPKLPAMTLLAGFLLGLPVRSSDPSAQGFDKVKTLAEAVEVIKQKIIQDGKPEYAALITESRMREAMRTGVKSYEALLEKRPEGKEHFQKTIKPILLKIADDGTWQQGCSFSCFYALTDRREGSEITYHGLGLRLEVQTPDKLGQGFALPIIYLYDGRFRNSTEVLAMSTDPSGSIQDLELGQRVLIKTGTFGGLQGVVTNFRRGGELPTAVRIELRIHGRPVPVEFTNPTVDELERI